VLGLKVDQIAEIGGATLTLEASDDGERVVSYSSEKGG
jgi:hypothetical protein